MADTKPRIKPIGALLCEDVRRESSGKHMVIGVYGESIVVETFPARLRLALYFMAGAPTVANVPFQIRFDGPVAKPEPKLDGEIQIQKALPDGSFIGYPLQHFLLGIASEGMLRIKFRQYEDRWTTLNRVHVHKRKGPSGS